MKKLSFLFLFVICSAALGAQTITAHNSVKDDMRIFVKDGEEVLTAFPSKYLKGDLKIGVILPPGYEKRQSPFPVVYILGQNLVSKQQIDENFYYRNNNNPQVVFVSILMPSRSNSAAEISEFFTLEALPYFELNYKISSSPKERVLAAAGPFAVKGLDIIATKGDYFKNLALVLFETTPLPAITGLKDDIKVWAAGNKSNMMRLQALLENSGLKFPAGFAYKFAAADKNKNLWSEVNLNYLLNAETRKVKKAKVYTSLQKISLAAMPSVEAWINVTLSGGYEVNYIPAEIKSAPPFFNWDSSTALLTPIYGADTGYVNVFGELPSGKPFTTDLELVK